MAQSLNFDPTAILYIVLGLSMIGYCVYRLIKNNAQRKGDKGEDKRTGNYDKLLMSLIEGARQFQVDGLAVEVRNCYDRADGRLDPRTEETGKMTREYFLQNRASLHPELQNNEVHLFGPENPERFSPLEYHRIQFGWVSQDRSSGVKTTRLNIDGSRSVITAFKYEIPSDDKNRPCAVFFHGGGFFGGAIPTTENQCKLLAELSGAVVISVDYPLAPENPFPEGFDACYETVVYACDNADDLGVSRRKIAVFGDSAGGNLALCSALRDRDEGRGMIAYMALIYPTVTRAKVPSDEFYYFKKDAYDNLHNDPYIEAQIEAIGKGSDELERWYIPDGEDPMQPYISPITASMDGLPQALVMTAEYDFLRMECEALSRKLVSSGVKSRHIRYGGIVHGVFDRLGYAPQVEDMLKEIAKDLRRLK